jgi:hypothetical protein
MLPDLFLDGQRALDSVTRISQALENMPDRGAVELHSGTQSGLGQEYGQQLAVAANTLGLQLTQLRRMLATHADALKASIDALSKTDQLAAQEAEALTALIDGASSNPPQQATTTGGMKYDY